MIVDESTKEFRRNICNLCPNKRGNFKLFGFTLFKRVPQCKVCKCAILLKTALTDAECPLNKW